MGSKEVSAYYRYATTDPFVAIAPVLIRQAYADVLAKEDIEPSLRHARAGMLASELVVHSTVLPHDATRWAKQATDHFNCVTDGSNQAGQARLWGSYGSQFLAASESGSTINAGLLRTFAKGFSAVKHDVENDNLYGFVNEVGMHIAVAALRRHGLTARPAFIREESNLRRNAGVLRNRDLTVFSNGDSIPSGTYAVQVKTSRPSRDTASYDQRITTLYGEAVHGTGDNSVRSLAQSVHSMTKNCIRSDGTIDFVPTARVVDVVLASLAETGPYTS